MKKPAFILLAALLLAACAGSRLDSEREWQRAQCAHIIDQEARDKCLKNL
jgi:hypothetical protein